MRFEDERYVRLFTRDTTTWKLLPWQAKCLLPLLLRKVDRAGIVEVGEDAEEGVAALTDLPPSFVKEALPGLLARKVFVLNGEVLVMPNFPAAQEAKASDRARQAAKRERDRLAAMGVTQRDGASRGVTERHAESRGVTPSRAVLSRTDPSRAAEEERARGPGEPAAAPAAPAAPPAPAGPPAPTPGPAAAPAAAARGPGAAAPAPAPAPRARREGQQQAIPQTAPPAELGKPRSQEQRRVVDRHRAAAAELLAELNAARRQVVPRAQAFGPTYENLGAIATRLDAGATPAEVRHVIAVAAGEVRAGGAARWFNPSTPFTSNWLRNLASTPKGSIMADESRAELQEQWDQPSDPEAIARDLEERPF